jgi:hypothetical protein
MKKFFAASLVTIALFLSAALAVAEQRDTTQVLELTVSSRLTIYDPSDASKVLGYRMEAQSGQHMFYLACMNAYQDCWPLNPNTGTFSFHYIDNNTKEAYPITDPFIGNMAVTTGDGTRCIFAYWDR